MNVRQRRIANLRQALLPALLIVLVLLHILISGLSKLPKPPGKTYKPKPYPHDRDRAIEQLREDNEFRQATPLRDRI